MTEPDKFHQAEIEFAGDALTHPQIGNILSKAAGRESVAVSVLLPSGAGLRIKRALARRQGRRRDHQA